MVLQTGCTVNESDRDPIVHFQFAGGSVVAAREENVSSEEEDDDDDEEKGIIRQ